MPKDATGSSQAAHRLAMAVDQAVSAAVPDLIDLQVVATAAGVVVLSARVSSTQKQQQIEVVARSVAGVR